MSLSLGALLVQVVAVWWMNRRLRHRHPDEWSRLPRPRNASFVDRGIFRFIWTRRALDLEDPLLARVWWLNLFALVALTGTVVTGALVSAGPLSLWASGLDLLAENGTVRFMLAAGFFAASWAFLVAARGN